MAAVCRVGIGAAFRHGSLSKMPADGGSDRPAEPAPASQQSRPTGAGQGKSHASSVEGGGLELRHGGPGGRVGRLRGQEGRRQGAASAPGSPGRQGAQRDRARSPRVRRQRHGVPLGAGAGPRRRHPGEAALRRGHRRQARPAALHDRPADLRGAAARRRGRSRARRSAARERADEGVALRAAGQGRGGQQAGLRRRRHADEERGGAGQLRALGAGSLEAEPRLHEGDRHRVRTHRHVAGAGRRAGRQGRADAARDDRQARSDLRHLHDSGPRRARISPPARQRRDQGGEGRHGALPAARRHRVQAGGSHRLHRHADQP